MIDERRLLYLIVGIAAFATSLTVVVGLLIMDERRQTTNTNTTTNTTTLTTVECLFATNLCFTVPPDVVTTRR
ncbi:MAG: hypothetical protein ACRD5J_07040 [Nitrososphaeraceae archaeon]